VGGLVWFRDRTRTQWELLVAEAMTGQSWQLHMARGSRTFASAKIATALC
jgi:hypothetical protein